jgi:ligand-binding sensor domain-containing protein
MRILTIFFIIISQILYSQSIKIMNPLDSGKPYNVLFNIGIDKSGNIWATTVESGLVKYNGKDFDFFNDSNSEIKGNATGPLYVDSKGNIWIGFLEKDKQLYGFVKYDGKVWTKSFKGNNLNFTLKINEDSKGNIYFAQRNKIIVFDGKNWYNINFPKGNYTTRSLAIDSIGTIAIGHHNGLLIKRKNVWISYKIGESEVSSIPTALCFDQIGNLFIGYYGNGEIGFSILDTNNHWKHYSKSNSDLPDNSICDIKMDKYGILWMTTNKGLVKFDNGVISSFNLRDNIDENYLYNIAIEENTIWISSSFGLIKFNE